ncbi:MAG: SLC13 family permease [Pseudorhodobacter sp.]|nr:SLC13 family permease [Pseudorhodobacter sp.]
MTQDNLLILTILAAMIGMFLWGRWRHDMVALGALLATVIAGLVPGAEAFSGFGHPAVITVACVLVLSGALQNSGAVDVIARHALPKDAGLAVSLGALVALGAAISGVMNNVGAMALLMPVAVRLSSRLGVTPGQMLMPLAFGTILGGMTTLIGTPPNLIVAGFRAEATGAGFAMFDFAPVGVAIALLGTLFLTLIGWRLVPARKPARAEDFETGAYLTEVTAKPDAKAVGLTMRQLEAELADAEAQVVALIRNGVRITAPHGGRRVTQEDILVLEAEVSTLADGLQALGLVTASHPESEETGGEGVVLRELVVLPGASILGRSAADLALRTRFGLNLLALSRKGKDTRARLRRIRFEAGDVLLMQGQVEAISEFGAEGGAVPLAERELATPDRSRAITATAIMLGAIAVAAFGLLPAAVAFAGGVLASMVFGTVPLRRVYEAIDWPVVVLLGALIPVANAMQDTGTADLIARFLMDWVAQGNAVVALALILIVTMFLSDVMNNAATAAVMCPIALQTAQVLGVNPDSYLMAVAVGASCAFLTPIGHQNNTLILGPGGFGFGDYWRLGLPLEILIVIVSVPLLLVVWPL